MRQRKAVLAVVASGMGSQHMSLPKKGLARKVAGCKVSESLKP